MITGYYAKVLAQSWYRENTLTTMHICLPWYITPELLRHRMFSFSSASTRAIGTKMLLDTVEHNPAIPLELGPNCKGMQSADKYDPKIAEELEDEIRSLAKETTMRLRGWSANYNPHKQFINKYLMPFLWCNIIITGTAPAYANFFALRIHKDAAPEMQEISEMMADAYIAAPPKILDTHDWHMPMMVDGDYEAAQAIADYETAPNAKNQVHSHRVARWCSARIARISIVPHDGAAVDREKDEVLFQRLAFSVPMHASPMEHIAQTKGETDLHVPGNFGHPWMQFRHMLPYNTKNIFLWKGKTIR